MRDFSKKYLVYNGDENRAFKSQIEGKLEIFPRRAPKARAPHATMFNK
ncbi:MAG: hypothetical protein FWF20_07205 [Betaproteobacteria bacterium]|nr:hypothetical protein [Betaproteobacteria bacterium]